MNVSQTHKLEFNNNQPPTIQELKAMLAIAEKQGFNVHTPVHIRAGTDDRDHDYYFHATIGAEAEKYKADTRSLADVRAERAP